MSLSVDKSIRKAKRYADAGDVSNAAALYRSVLEKYPSNKRASQGLNALDGRRSAAGGAPPRDQVNALVALSARGDAKAAIDAAQTLARQFPTSIELLNIIGVANIKLGCFDEAAVAFEKALAVEPDCVEARWNLGRALKNLGRNEDALAHYEEARRLAPHRAEAHKNLGDAYLGVHRLKDATAAYERALDLKPDYSKALNNLGYALIELDRLQDAAAALENAIKIKPDFAEALNNLGNAYKHLSRHEDAIARYEEAIRIKPDYAEAYNSLGAAFSDFGRRNDAAASYEKAVTVWPGFARAHHNLSSVKKFASGDPQIAQMSNLLKQDGIADSEKTLLHFGLGKAHDDLAQYEEAFAQFAEGNRLRKKLIGYDIADDRDLFARIRAMHDALEHANTENLQTSGATPVFIVGMPRSGTSLVEQILASHSEVHGGGELTALENTIKTLSLLDANTPSSLLADLAHEYRQTLNARANGAVYVTDKMPLNFRWIGLIRAALPTAKIVHVKRDPRATGWSIFRRSFAMGGNGYAYDLHDIAGYYQLYKDLMTFWDETFPGAIHHLDYEKLTVDQHEQTRALLDYVGLDWEDQCLAFDKIARAVATASAHQVRKPIYQGSSEAWRNYAPFISAMTENLPGI